MKKRKTVVIVTAFSLLITGVLCIGIYVWQFFWYQNTKQSMVSDYSGFAQDCFRDMSDPQRSMHWFTARGGANLTNEFPYVAAVMDARGNMLAHTGDALLTDMVDKQTLSVTYSTTSLGTDVILFTNNTLILDLEPYVTAELREQVRAFSENLHGNNLRGNPCLVSSFSLYEQDGVYTPVSATLKTDSGNHTCDLFFTDFEPTVVRNITGSSRLYMYSVCRDKKLAAACADMETNLSSLQQALAKSLKRDVLTVQQTLQSNSRFPTLVLPLTQDDSIVWFVLTYTYRPFIGALKWSARYYAIALPVCAMLYAFALFLALRHLRRKAQLETSRYSFLSAAAHELKTPLSVILSSGECIRDGIAPEKTKEYSEKILAQGERMQGLISQMLQQNRLLSADSVKKTPFDLSVLLAEEAKKYLTAADQKDIILVTDIEPDVMILADRELIALAVDNYLSNAVKYAPEKAGVTVSLHRTGRKATVTVANTGSRIAKEDLPHIFEELYRADQVRSGGSGSGLGLSIARRIFELHGYRYGAASDETSTRFFFSAKETHRM